jgi:hypothetical protein
MGGAFSWAEDQWQRCANLARRVVLQTPLLRQRRDSARTARQAAVSQGGTPLGETLREHAFGRMDAAQFASLLAPRARQALERLTGEARLGSLPEDRLLVGAGLLAVQPETYRIGFDPALLSIAEGYLGRPCLYIGAALKREAVDHRLVGNRRWHMDVEDERVLRALIYLSPVDRGCGPFEYVPESASRRAQADLGYRRGYLDDRRLAQQTRAEERRDVLGRPGDVVFFDGARLFHRAQPPQVAERLSLTLTYVSQWPIEWHRGARLTGSWRRRLARDLDERQRASLAPVALLAP